MQNTPITSKVNNSQNTFTTAILTLLALAVLVMLACMPSSGQSRQAKSNNYQQVNLVSDLLGVALLQDTNLVNSWGTSFSGTSPFWISDNGSGLATLSSLQVPTAKGTDCLAVSPR